jgi:hypothetical protein
MGAAFCESAPTGKENVMKRLIHSALSLLAFAVISLFLATPGYAQSPKPLTQSMQIAGNQASISYSADWSVGPNSNGQELFNVPLEAQARMDAAAFNQVARILVTMERRLDHAEAVNRLNQIMGNTTSPANLLTINGWPALQRRYLTQKPVRGEDAEKPEMLLIVSTAIAQGDIILRVDGYVPADAPAAIADEVEAIGRSVVFRQAGDPTRTNQEIEHLRLVGPPKPIVLPPAPLSPSRILSPSQLNVFDNSPGLITSLSLQDEPEVAVSTNGRFIVVAQQCNIRASSDGGQNFSPATAIAQCNGGDSSLAFGRSGAFYEANIGNSGTGTRNATIINISNDNGQTFNFQATAFVCSAGTCGFSPPVPDQEHIAADRFNASSTGQDLVYVVWRRSPGVQLACSINNGATWTSPPSFFNEMGGNADFPRITVGQDGFVYVIYKDNNQILINKFSPCALSGGQPVAQPVAGFPQLVATVNPSGPNFPQYVLCPVPGLDRCNDSEGNALTSMMVAVDDTNANHIYVSYAAASSSSDEDIIVQDSTNGGSSWNSTAGNGRIVQVSSGIQARRFMPWVCSAGGAAYVSWYDRRAASPTSNDLTDYFAASASLDAVGNLAAGPEFQVNAPGSADAQCAAGQPSGNLNSWFCGVRSAPDATSCSAQPQLAGRCFSSGIFRCPGGTPAPVGSGQTCDLRTGFSVCPAGESCTTGVGVPKYGDYNGNACAAGRFYNVWVSGTSPAGVTNAGLGLYYRSKIVCCQPQIQVPAPITLAACPGSSTVGTLNVCNTGKADLAVDPITSDSPQISVTPPSSGYPVTITPTACFPFEAKFTPTGASSVFATLTIPTNDTVNPSAKVQATGNVSPASITTVISDSGNFGNACVGSFVDLPLTIGNSGGCSLSVTGISSSSPSPEFSTANVISFPLTIGAGDSIEVPIRFQPVIFGQDSETILVSSNDPVNGTVPVAVSGNAPRPRETNTSCSFIAIDSGDSDHDDAPFLSDRDFSGGSTSSTSSSINTVGVTLPAPQQVYRTVRSSSGSFTYTIPGFTPNSNHAVRLHFADIRSSNPGTHRTFNVFINSNTTPVLSGFDIVVAAGGVGRKAVVKELAATADANGQIVIRFVTVMGRAVINAIEIE